MKNDMSKMMQKLSYILNDKDMPNDLKDMLNQYVSGTSSSNNNPTSHINNSIKNNNRTDNTYNNSKSSDNNSSFPDFEEFSSSFNINNSNTSSTTSDSSNSSNCSQSDSTFNPFSSMDIGTILKMKQVMDSMNQKKNDPRSNLLLSLKPYLRPTRKQKIDQYIQLFNMGSIMENFKSTGGEKTK